MELEYRSPAARERDGEGVVWLIVLRSIVVYLALSAITVPFLDAIWVGELPVVALVQVPKVGAANWVREMMVRKVMGPMGLSAGSFSPDWIRARRLALGVVYGVGLGVVAGVVWWRKGLRGRWGKWLMVMVGMGVVDYVMTLAFAGGPGFSIY